LVVPTEARGYAAIHDTTVYTVFTTRAADGSLWQAGIARMAHRAAAKHLEISVLHGDGTNTVATQGAMAWDRRETRLRQGQRVSRSQTIISLSSHPPPVAPVHETDMPLLPQGLNAVKQAATQVGADLRGASLNLDGGCDAARHRTGVFPAGLIPNITESPRKRKTTERGCK
jgi:hypothetical protein